MPLHRLLPPSRHDGWVDATEYVYYDRRLFEHVKSSMRDAPGDGTPDP